MNNATAQKEENRAGRVAILISISLFTAASCSRSPTPISQADPPKGTLRGTIFIVTKGAVNIRLGDVGVLLFENTAFEKFKSQVEDRAARESEAVRISLRDYYKKTTNLVGGGFEDLESKRQQVILWTSRIDALNKAYSVNLSRDRKLAWKQYTEANDLTVKADELSREISHASYEIKLINSEIDQLKTAWPERMRQLYFRDLPIASQTTKTDPDGNFSFQVARTNRYVLVAESKRKVAVGETEHYEWIVEASLGGEEGKEVILSNHNLMTEGSSETPITVFPFPSIRNELPTPNQNH